MTRTVQLEPSELFRAVARAAMAKAGMSTEPDGTWAAQLRFLVLPDGRVAVQCTFELVQAEGSNVVHLDALRAHRSQQSP